jgi:hypothetical protein
MSFLTPLAFLGALLAIPIILLYMLRLRRREILVSSTYLWQQILQDNEANTPWQRLRRNILLFLQLLILLFLVLALARPFVVVPAVGAGQIALLLDASASMNATDMNGSTRLDEAKRQALDIVDTLGAVDTMTVIRVAEVPEVLAPATNDPLILRNAINGVQPSQAAADWVAALTLAAGEGRNAEDFNVVIVSDGSLGDPARLPTVTGEVRYMPVGRSSSNVAITALATRALPGQSPQLFAQITNFGGQDADVIFDLRVDDELFTADRYTIPAGQSVPLISRALPSEYVTLQAGLTLPAGSTVPDYLAQDNTAWSVSSGAGARRVLVMTPNNLFLEQVLRSLPAVDAVRGDITRGVPTSEYDLYIFDSYLPDTLPDGDLLIINPPRSTSLFTVGAQSDQTANPAVASDDPRMTFVDFDNVHVLAFKPVSADWAEPLVTVEGGTLLLAGEVDGRQVAVLTFDLHNSDLPLQITWPVLMANLMEWYTPRDVLAANSLKVGDSLVIRPPFEAERVRITHPDGSERSLPIDRDTLVYAGTGQSGIYQLDVLAGGEVIQSAPFAVNLFDAGESDITPQAAIVVGGAATTEAEEEELGQREYWPWAALLALLILLIEWYVYHRRLRAPTMGRVALRRRPG